MSLTYNFWPTRLYALDFSRGLASLSVVLWHWQHFAYQGTSKSEDFIREDQPLYDILTVFYEAGGAGVSYFFILSGFIFFWLYREPIQGKKITSQQFAIQRFSRLYPLHFATLITVALLQFVYISRQGDAFVYPYNDLYHFMLNLGFASKWGFEEGWSFNAPVWSVSIEVLLYALFFVTASRGKGGLLFSLSVSIASFILFFVADLALLKGVALFFLGGFSFQLTTLISSKYRFLALPLYVTAVLLWLCVLLNYYALDLNISSRFGAAGKIFVIGYVNYALFPLTIVGLALFEIKNGAVFRPVGWVGDITYSTYLLHFPLQLIFGLAVAYGVLGPQFFWDARYLAIYFVILIVLSHLTYRQFERPMQRAIRERLAEPPSKS